ncbi:WxL protein peptidoglycan domain-containing protein, partial [Pseudactinotalea sp.]|uniref:WxL protein peptidoglycan domain-containing protein n=1 Tax=Pseudactinotalea sp. TaxID=1926260 RepID=UPI003B3A15F3
MRTRTTTHRRAALTLLVVSVLTAVAAAPAVADEIAWSVAPSNNEHGDARPNYGYQLEPGAVIQDGLEVANTGEVELTLAVAAADGFTTANGVLDLVPVTDPQLDLGAWVVPEVSELTLAPGERVEVPFTLTVPQDAAPGDHTGGIVTIRTSDAGGTVQLEQRLASRIHVRVPGEQVVTLAVSDLEIDQPA